MKRRVLVTGANGYIGRHVVESLLQRGDVVYITSSKPDDFGGEVRRLDQSCFDLDIGRITETCDSCIHLAWRDGFRHNSDAHMADLSAHYLFLSSLCAGGLKSLTVMGTMHEVGYWVGPIDEHTPTDPHSLYGIAKDSLRKALTANLKDSRTDFRWLRAFYITGDDRHSQSVFGKILRSYEDGKRTFPFTSGRNQCDFIDVAELARQIVAADAQSKILGVINCCSGQPEALAARVLRFLSENGIAMDLQYGAFPDREYDSPSIWGDASKIRQILAATASEITET
ncbi:NAD-dependent epimerase/dehydratase family protein [Brevundimonas vesicularis]|uniref:NAD(P)-dependent oxidoreductase n=1 Tax=Brevundimonas vesicularis TaxID=41276 RepID=A0A1Z3U8D7_BREVE|nr:NAD(P)-dependent oxidoreductase [Brevundimonas vesicularis]ASE39420.1 NAD(P)-dependent oxidoreductase [Brevundimonas vesicularis]MDX2335354.1 NAD(P)-dependent oxidoreductase [Brevundimonas vesicularis]